MAVSKEVVKGIIDFNPGRIPVEGQKIHLGRFNGTDVKYGNYPVQDRLIDAYDPEEPALLSLRTRPVVVLERRGEDGHIEVQSLAYRRDIRSLAEKKGGLAVLELTAVLIRWPKGG